MKFLRKNLFLVFLIGLFLSTSLSLVHAQSTPTVTNSTPGATNATPATTNSTPTGTTLTNPLNASSLQQLLQEVLDYVTFIGGTIVLPLMLVYVGFLFVMARGNPEKVSSARSALLWTAIGGLLLLGASAIAMVITNTASSL